MVSVPPLSSAIIEAHHSGIREISNLAMGRPGTIRLEVGQPDFPTPSHVAEAGRKAIQEGWTFYTQTAGLPSLRERLAAKLARVNGLSADPAQIACGSGGVGVISAAMAALLEPGDEVLIPDPTWTCVQHLITLCGGVVRRVPLHEERDWTFDPAEVRAAITPRTRVLMINSPHNPTGGVLGRADLEALAAIVAEHPQLTVVSDEAYEHVIYDGVPHVSFASLPGMYARTATVFTCSKSYAMTGLRVGYVVTPDKRIMERMQKVVLYTTNGINSVAQWGAVAALTGPQSCLGEFQTEYQARRDLFYSGLRDLPIFKGDPPKGAFYAFVRIADGWRDEQGRTGSWPMTEYLLQSKVGSSPGVIFGPSGENYLRFSTACSREDLSGALTAMQELFAGSYQAVS